MIRTIHVDDSSSKAQALLEFLLTLDFVREEKDSDDFVLTEEQLQIIDERRKSHLSGNSKSYSWEEIKNSLGKDSK